MKAYKHWIENMVSLRAVKNLPPYIAVLDDSVQSLFGETFVPLKEEWYIMLGTRSTYNLIPLNSKRRSYGFYLTRKGYEDNEEAIVAAGAAIGKSRAEIEEYFEEFFNLVKTKTSLFIDKLKDEVNFLESVEKTL